MMRTPFVSRSRVTGQALAQGRAAWVLVLNTSKAVGEIAAQGEFPAKDQAVTFAGLVVRSDRQFYPLTYASAEAAKAAWREHARGFIAATVPELKAALGQAMAASARCCLRMIELEDLQHARQTARRLGEREE